MDKIIDRFKRYIAVDTKSDNNSTMTPSTKGQIELGTMLVEELLEIGLEDAVQDDYGHVYATLPANSDCEIPTIGFIAHLDTSPDLDGKVVNPQIVEYVGGDIKLNDKYSIKIEEFPELEGLKGKMLITTDGTTLLGADDKAGIAEIVDAMEYLINNPDIKHGKVKIGFTPDEEIGRGTMNFDVERFGADFAYTFDGGHLGELQYENFNAATVKIKIQGKNVHSGTAKNVMVNSIKIAIELDAMIPKAEVPEHTEKLEGFYHLSHFTGTVDQTDMKYSIREHCKEKFESKKAYIIKIINFLNDKYGKSIEVEIEDDFFNMREMIESHMGVVYLAEKSMKDLGIDPNIEPIRGGTDGSRLSYRGLPAPNIFSGGYNFHGRFEFIPIENMRLASKLIVKIVENAPGYFKIDSDD